MLVFDDQANINPNLNPTLQPGQVNQPDQAANVAAVAAGPAANLVAAVQQERQQMEDALVHLGLTAVSAREFTNKGKVKWTSTRDMHGG